MPLTCPTANYTTYNDFTITCLHDIQYSDLPSYSATSLEGCINSCIAYIPDFDWANGASCIAITFNPGNPNGDKCYRKYAISTERFGINATGLVAAVKVGVNGTTTGSNVVSALVSVSATATTGAPLGTDAVVVAASAATSATSTPSASSSASASATSAAAAGDNNNSGLSTGATAGLAVGVVLGVLVIAGFVFLFLFARRLKARRATISKDTTTSEGGLPLATPDGGHVEKSGENHMHELAPATEWDSTVGAWVKTKQRHAAELGGGGGGRQAVTEDVTRARAEGRDTVGVESAEQGKAP